MNLEKTLAEKLQKQETISLLEKNIEQLTCSVAEMECKLRSEESTRRQLHNTIQELKGNIRVYCRVRPTLESENGQTMCQFSFADKELAIESSTPTEVR